MSITTKQQAGLWEVAIEGDVTLPAIREVRDRLLEALGATDHVSLDLTRVDRVDLSCLQVFCALHKTAIANEKRVSFAGKLPLSIKDAMERAGYWRDAGCHRKLNGDCLLGGASYA